MALVSLQDQWERFTAEVPAGEAPVLSAVISPSGASTIWTATRPAGRERHRA